MIWEMQLNSARKTKLLLEVNFKYSIIIKRRGKETYASATCLPPSNTGALKYWH